jgi:putative ABC transport system substrate-binding protein
MTVSDSAAWMRRAIIGLAAKHRIPAIYPFRYYAAAGGLMSYGFDLILQYKDAADYANRILRGTAVACLPGATTNKVWVCNQS